MRCELAVNGTEQNNVLQRLNYIEHIRERQTIFTERCVRRALLPIPRSL